MKPRVSFLPWPKRKTLSNRLRPDKYRRLNIPYVDGMISHWEQHALACFAQHIWEHGPANNALIIDAGCYLGSSTVSLAEGLRRSPLPEPIRRERIWSYDLFRTTRQMSHYYLKERGLRTGDTFRPIFEKNIAAYRHYVRVQSGDILKAPIPLQPVSILFLDILWSWDTTSFIGHNYYPLLEPGRSLLIHQDFVYPFYPWVILSMGLLRESLVFAYNVQYSSVVFDVKRKLHSRDIHDPRNIPLPQALQIYDEFIDRVSGWAKGSLALGKAMYLASLNRLSDARTIIDNVALKFANESLVTQYLDSVRKYCDKAEATGEPTPLEEAVGI